MRIMKIAITVLLLGVLQLPYLGQSLLAGNKQLLLNRHNFVRGTVQPPATNMLRMTWDDNLADIAEDIAGMCTTNTSMFDLEPGIGVNTAHIIGTAEEKDVRFVDVLESYWESQGPPFYEIYENECKLQDSFCQSYKQIVFASANKLGCEIAECEDFSMGGITNPDSSLLLVCTYEGNVTPDALDSQPYVPGDRCTDCPSETHCDLHGLCAVGLSDDEISQFVNGINTFRRMVDPPANNMLTLSWNKELAMIAQSYSDNCEFVLNENRNTQTESYETLGENIFIVDADGFNISSVLEEWFEERLYFEYEDNACHALCYCENYLQLVAAETETVGCGVTNCPKADRYAAEDVVLVICNFGPGRDPEQPAYRTGGDPCSGCTGMIVCDNKLCTTDKNVMAGSDPHFSVLLPSGNILCYSVQGKPNLTFNLISNDKLEMNALFIPDEITNNTWLGSIGITMMNNVNKANPIQLRFDAQEEMIRISRGIDIDAHTVRKLFFRDGKLRILDAPRREYKKHPKVLVHFEDSGIKFSVTFAKKCHLDLSWHSSGQATKSTHGLIGQFLQEGVRIDGRRSLLILPHKPPVEMKQRKMWKFMEKEATTENPPLCWTSVEVSKQGENVIEGTYLDYIVQDVYSTEFRERRQHLNDKFLRK